MLDLLEILEHVDPAKLDYQQWINVGMALAVFCFGVGGSHSQPNAGT